MNLVMEHVRIENPERAVAALNSKNRSCSIKRTTTPPPPIPPIVARAIMMTRTTVPIPSMRPNVG
jgi:hypothetical protein